jgi:hypothetical protein
MSPILSDALVRRLPLLVLAGLSFTTAVAAQDRAAPEIISNQISTSRNAASLRLELSDGRSLDIAMRGGRAYLNGDLIEAPNADAALDRSFRDLLRRLPEASTQDLPQLLKDWSPGDAPAAAILDQALENAVQGVMPADGVDAAPVAPAAPSVDGVPASDSVDRLVDRITELEGMVDQMDEGRSMRGGQGRHRWMPSPWESLLGGLGDIFRLVILYAILLAVAVGIISFGGRKYIDGVADTARQLTMRSWLVGLAGSFLVVPAFILGTIALAISIVGIPALLVWVPLFPVAVVAAGILGYLGVAHATGEGMAERRVYGSDWFKRSNSYYFILNGMGLLLAAFIAASVVEMAGPWLGFIRGLLIFLGVVATWAAITIGFGAVLISRAGTRPLGRPPVLDTDAFSEDVDV